MNHQRARMENGYGLLRTCVVVSRDGDWRSGAALTSPKCYFNHSRLATSRSSPLPPAGSGPVTPGVLGRLEKMARGGVILEDVRAGSERPPSVSISTCGATRALAGWPRRLPGLGISLPSQRFSPWPGTNSPSSASPEVAVSHSSVAALSKVGTVCAGAPVAPSHSLFRWGAVSLTPRYPGSGSGGASWPSPQIDSRKSSRAPQTVDRLALACSEAPAREQ